MKKYTILDSSGQKKIVYAPNMKKALRYVGDGEKTVIKDSNVGDSTVSIWWSPYRQYGLDDFIKKYGLNIHTHVPYPATSPHSGIDYVATGKKEDLITLLTKIKRTELISKIKDSEVKDEDDYFYFDADEDNRSLDDYKRIMKQCGLTITKVEGNNREAFIYYRGSSSAEQKAAKMLGISLEDSVKDSKFKDADANIVDKLISEEEKAVMDYKEALMADSDLSANAVYAHILAEELEHLRELRSLREQPSLGDSIKDAVKKINDPSAIEKELQKNLKNPDIEYAGDAYDESDLPIAIYGDSTRKTATDIAKYLKSKGYTGVVIDHEGSDYFATVHA